jgi:titin
LTTGKYYTFQVSAVNEVGEGTLSAEFGHYAKSLPGQPEAPTYVSSTEDSVTTASVSLEWTPLTDTGGVPLTGYKVYYIDDSTSTTTLGYDGSGAPETSSCTISSLVLDETYDFYVVGLNGDAYDEGTWSDSLTLVAAALPDAPGAITEVTRIDNSIEVTWVASANDGGSALVAYTLYLVEDNQDDLVVYYGTANSATVMNLEDGETYYFKATASNAVGESDASDIYSFLIVEAPSAPLNIALDSYDNTFVTFSWELPLFNGGQALSGFKVYRESCDDSTSTPTLLGTLVAS